MIGLMDYYWIMMNYSYGPMIYHIAKLWIDDVGWMILKVRQLIMLMLIRYLIMKFPYYYVVIVYG